MTDETNVSLGFLQQKLSEVNAENRHLKAGGGGGTSDGMEPRVKAFEDGQRRIEEKLDKVSTQAAEIKGQLSAMPSATTFGDIKGALGKLEGRVDALPTTAKLSGMLAIAVALMTIITKWSEVKAIFHG